MRAGLVENGHGGSDPIDRFGRRAEYESASGHHGFLLGGLFSRAINDHVSPHVGVAWWREFYGKARAAANDLVIPSPSLRGDTVIGEIGIPITPSASLPS